MRALSKLVALVGFISLTLLAKPTISKEQALKIIFPFSAGGSTDAVVRLLADQLQKNLGRPVIVENRPGAGGRIATKTVKDASPDGATLLFASVGTVSILPILYPQLDYNPLNDLTPISQVMSFDLAIADGPQSAARSLQDLIAWLKAHPQLAAFGSPGAGTLPHFAGFALARASNIELRHVAYKGTSAALPDLLAGRIPMYIAAASELQAHHKVGQVRILATSNDMRSSFVPDVPTFREAGFAFQASGWWAVYVPLRTPPDVVEHLNKAIISVVKDRDFRDRVLTLGFHPTGTTSEELRHIQWTDYDLWQPIVKASGFIPAQ